MSTTQEKPTLESAVDNGKRAFALKKFEEAVDHYATALEIAIEKFPEDSVELADLHFTYGKALLENAIANSGVLGKAEPEGEKEDEAPATGKGGPFLSFSGDGEDEDGAVDLFAQAAKEVAAADAAQAQGAEEEDDEDEGEPEDDFNAAWEVLEVARSIYDKHAGAASEGASDALKHKLAETYISLGDVSLETEKFEQAILDYEEGTKLKDALLPLSSRQIAEAHYKLSMVLDMTSGRLSDAIRHAELALKSLELRKAELGEALEKGDYGKPAPPPAEDAKGKGKASSAVFGADPISTLSKSNIEGEIKELDSLLEDLGLKVDELKTSPNETLHGSAPELAQAALEKELNGAAAPGLSSNMPVNDLSGMVKKKKRPAAAPAEPSASSTPAPADSQPGQSPPGKRKAEDEPSAEEVSAEKKVKLGA
ncbi:hypothetical protein EV122DRAFT_276874 [Schizophyllum commune]